MDTRNNIQWVDFALEIVFAVVLFVLMSSVIVVGRYYRVGLGLLFSFVSRKNIMPVLAYVTEAMTSTKSCPRLPILIYSHYSTWPTQMRTTSTPPAMRLELT